MTTGGGPRWTYQILKRNRSPTKHSIDCNPGNGASTPIELNTFESADFLERIEDEPLRVDALRADLSQVIDIATAYVSEVLLGRFQEEHPYMLKSLANVSRADADQLARFATTFGFGPGDWHLTRAADQIERYMYKIDADTGRTLQRFDVSGETVDRLKRIRLASVHLDGVLAKAR